MFKVTGEMLGCGCWARFHDSVHLKIAPGSSHDREMVQPSQDEQPL